MAVRGQTLQHPITGEELTFIRTAADTGGECLEMEFRVKPGGAPAAVHLHPRSTERFEVLEGALRALIDGNELHLGPGESAAVPAGTPHTWNSVGDRPLRMTVTLTPALACEGFFEDMFGLAEADRVNRKGMPSPLAVFTVLHEHPDACYLARPPIAVQKALAGMLGPLGRALGVLQPARRVRATDPS